MLTWWKVSSICYTVLFGFTISILHFICPLAHSRFLFFFSVRCCLVSIFCFSDSFLFPFDMYKHGFPSHSFGSKGNFFSVFALHPTTAMAMKSEETSNYIHTHTQREREPLAEVMTKSMVERDREIKRQRARKKNQQLFHTKCLLFSVLLCWLTIETYEDTTSTQLLLFDLAVLFPHLGGNVNKQTFSAHTHTHKCTHPRFKP